MISAPGTSHDTRKKSTGDLERLYPLYAVREYFQILMSAHGCILSTLLLRQLNS